MKPRLHLWSCAVAMLTAIPVFAQTAGREPSGDNQPERPRQRGRDRGGDERRGDRGGFRDRMQRMRDATPEQLRQMRIDGWVDMLTRTYDLSDQQRAQVKAEVTKIGDEYRASLGKDAEEMDKLDKEMRDYWRQQAESRANADGPDANGENADRGARRRGRGPRGNPMDDPKFRELAERMRGLREQHPIDWQGGIDRIESLLPAEQAAKGRERREQWMNQRQNRGNPGNDPELGPTRRGGRRNRDNARADASSNGPLAGGARSQSPVLAAPTAPPHPWDVYTNQFIARLQLTASQATSAHAIVKELKDREVAVRRSQTDARAAAEKIVDSQAKAKKLQEMDAPVDALFAELKTRLEGLLTAAQRENLPKGK